MRTNVHTGYRSTQKAIESTGIHIKPSRKGLLHKKLGVPQGKPIPAAKLLAAKNSSSPAERKEANFAINAKKFKH